MKLLYDANSIQKAISFSIIYRENKLSNKLTFDKINETIEECIKRLDRKLDKDRPFLFWIIEIAQKSHQKKSWYCDNLDTRFVMRKVQ
jgi:hypothetical protein